MIFSCPIQHLLKSSHGNLDEYWNNHPLGEKVSSAYKASRIGRFGINENHQLDWVKAIHCHRCYSAGLSIASILLLVILLNYGPRINAFFPAFKSAPVGICHKKVPFPKRIAKWPLVSCQGRTSVMPNIFTFYKMAGHFWVPWAIFCCFKARSTSFSKITEESGNRFRPSNSP